MYTPTDRMRYLRRFYVVILLVFLLTGCDSTDNFDVTRLDGTYQFTEFLFDIDATRIGDARVLDSLDADRTSLEFAAGTQSFVLRYRFTGDQSSSFLNGDFSTSEDGVTLRFDGDEDERQRLLLPDRLSLDILEDGDRLEASVDRDEVDLTRFDPEGYAGVPPVSGTLIMQLER